MKEKGLTPKIGMKRKKQHHIDKVKVYSNSIDTVKRRYIREINSGMLDVKKTKPETLIKYNIQFDTDKQLFY
jgi:hypothetical protein